MKLGNAPTEAGPIDANVHTGTLRLREAQPCECAEYATGASTARRAHDLRLPGRTYTPSRGLL